MGLSILSFPQVGGQLLKFLQNGAAQIASPWIVSRWWGGYLLDLERFPLHLFILQNPAKMEILQEQFVTLHKKMGLGACFLSLRPRFSSTGISKVLLTCSPSTNVDVQHQLRTHTSTFPLS